MPFDALVAEAEAWAPGAEGLLFLPYLAGERTPHADPDARGAFVGLDAAPRPRRAGARGARGRRLRARATRSTCSGRSASRRRRRGSRAAARAAVSGSGSSRPCSAVPLELTESEEGSAFGAALLGGVAGGVFADVHEAVDRCVRVTGTVEPDPAWHEAYLGAHERYGAVYPALRAVRVSS